MPEQADIARRQKQRIRRRRFGVNTAGYIAFDSFTRADSNTTLGSATEKGGAWTAITGTWGIGSLLDPGGQGFTTQLTPPYAYSVTHANADLAVTAAALNGSAQVDAWTSNWGTNGPVLAFRVVDASNSLLMNATSGACNLYTNITGSLVQIGTATVASVTGVGTHTMKATYNGTTVTCFFDGVQVIQVTLSGGGAAIAGTNAGFRYGSNTANAVTFDNWRVT